MDFAEQTGTTVDTSGESGLGYVTVTPLPSGTIFTETQSGLGVTWATYNVTVNINGTDFPVNFSAGDTKAVVIEKVPVGASLSATATIGVASTSAAAGLGYSSLTAVTVSPITIQSGSNTITMWVQYPLEFQVSSDYQPYASVTGTPPAYYTNAGSTALPEVTASYVDNATGKTMRFTGWSLTDGGPVAIPAAGIPAGQYKGKLSLWANYGECAVSISCANPPATGAPVVTPSGLVLTAVPVAFPDGAAISYSWEIVPPAGGTAAATVTGSGASATVSPVAGRFGSATVKVTATSGTLTASALQEVTVKCTLPAFTIDTTMAAGYSASNSTLSTPAAPVEIPVFALTSLDYPFTFTANPGTASFPAGTVARWEIQAKELTASKFVTPESPAPAADVFTETSSPSGLGLRNAGQTGATAANTISTAAAAASPISIKCTISHPYALEDVTVNATVQVFRQAVPVPAFKINVTSDGGLTNSPFSGGGAIFYIRTADLSTSITLEAQVDSSDPTATFPAGTQFIWKYGGSGTFTAIPTAPDTGSQLTRTLSLLSGGIASVPTTPASYTVECQAVLDGSPVSGATATVDVYLVSGMSASTLAGKTTAQLGSTKLSGSGTEADPYVLPSIIGLENSAVRNDLKNKMNNTWQKFCDLSNTVLPDTMTDMSSAFSRFTYMTAAPVIPSTVTNMERCFSQCPLLTTAPAIPEGVTNMEDCFYQCIYLTTAPVIPSTVTNMRGCFERCSALTTAPVIPEGVTDMTSCFYRCFSLTTAPAIPSSVDNMDQCFEECTNLTAAPDIPEGVTNMKNCFNECTSLTTASIIPSTVTDLTRCFEGCINLTGNVVIRANITDSDNYRGMFDVHDDDSGTYRWPGDSNPINIYVPTEAARNALIRALKTPADALSANTNFVYTEGSDPNPDGSIGTGSIKIYVGEP